MSDEDKIRDAWNAVRASATQLHVDLIKLRNRISNSRFKKSVRVIIDRLRSDINELEDLGKQ